MNQTYLLQLSESDLKTLIADTLRSELTMLLPDQPQPEPEEEPLLKVPDIEQMFGVCKQTVLSWSKAGKLPSVRIGNRLYFRKNEVLSLLKARSGGRA